MSHNGEQKMKYQHEKGMGSRRRHGGKVRRWDSHKQIKAEARTQRHNIKIALIKTLMIED